MSAHMDPRQAPYCHGLGVLMFQKMEVHKDRVALIDENTGRQQTYCDLKHNSIRIALALLSRNIQNKDVICLCSLSRAENISVFFATLFINAVFCGIDPLLSSDDGSNILKTVKPKLVFCDDKGAELIEKALLLTGICAKIIIFSKNISKHETFSKLLQENHDFLNFKPRIPACLKDTAFIVFTSGSTGLMKGVEISQFAVFSSRSIGSYLFNVATCLMYSTLQWNRCIQNVIAIAFKGSTLVLIDEFLEEKLFRSIEKYKVNSVFINASYLYRVIAHLKKFKYNLSSLELVITGSAPVSQQAISQLMALLPHVYVCRVYGMTETCSAISTSTLKDKIDKKERALSSGKLIMGCEIKVISLDSGQELGPNQCGEIRVLTPAIMNGYYNNREESDKLFEPEGYFRTGDFGYYDEDNYVYVLDRIKHLIKLGTEYIVPAAIAFILMEHCDVTSAVVIPVGAEGNIAMGVVTVRKGSSAKAYEIADFVNDRVADQNRLKAGVKIVDSIPMSLGGKPMVYKVKEMFR